jgi:hypothetical protein
MIVSRHARMASCIWALFATSLLFFKQKYHFCFKRTFVILNETAGTCFQCVHAGGTG